jgi:glucan phosphoethanolaminetransferase (alkaline phosphatase superfamily)
MLVMVTAINGLVAVAIWGSFQLFWPASYFAWFPSIPVFFWIIGMGMALSLESTHTEKPDSVAMTYMVARGVKLLLTAVFIGVYAWTVHDDLKQFGLTTLTYYIILLILESYCFFQYEKRKEQRRRAAGNKIEEPEPYSSKQEVEHNGQDK